ncbi:GNAT family N-acetyltransferase [Candidatus Micrarchaeota archaeon CG_4_10_14_0_2_um_filter_60_11]|nr:MAG: hypothetical protein AUJ16_01165 [Candidatus Micrarchaeota archaeon CG1_02_60_51]PIN96700.1 MAG: GNAT family N-acetyltransferase [Candidatus Micrarchaeota archaeon CG10_big_fil_rev_8_21_14_0_10_60_32]PIO01810.1 MAG: GNAT family N-acetyltransferase [Candidatus Micrarchaeota archaeon CG09_land_8_20_14_0_10_60_16]PIY92010.1 MAG: GNAT family N-acetyltransferase [Candidatus Micrarchaeota archaeon CG_4_10_14_0_8_um_filter_60_7]PIZ91151.1 MAG: GNAT family N-acetyltransferase [Candidatus Micrar
MKLEGAAVVLRAFKPSDAPAVCAAMKDGSVARWTLYIPWPYKKKDAVKFIRSRKTRWRKGKDYCLAVVCKEDGRLAGSVSLLRVDKKHKVAEMGYWLGARYRGKGLAAEAVALLLGLGFKKLGMEKIRGHVFAENRASQRLLEKKGFKREGLLRKDLVKRGKRRDLIAYGLLKREYKPLKARER